MRAWLAERAASPEQVESVIAFLTENLALDDARFSHAFAADKRDLAGWGGERIERVLRDRGVEPGLAREAASADAGLEIERAVKILRERGVTAGTDRERSRALGLLVRRGYSSDNAYAAVRRVSGAA